MENNVQGEIQHHGQRSASPVSTARLQVDTPKAH